MTDTPKTSPRVGLFATCLMNLFRPNIGFAAAKLLEEAGCIVGVPPSQTCCGQPGYNSGDNDSARTLAKQVIATFEDYDYLVGPSGSCMATIRHDYPVLFAADRNWRDRAEAVAAKSWELTSFLVDVLASQGFRPDSTQLRPIMTPAPACADSASKVSRDNCSPA